MKPSRSKRLERRREKLELERMRGLVEQLREEKGMSVSSAHGGERVTRQILGLPPLTLRQRWSRLWLRVRTRLGLRGAR